MTLKTIILRPHTDLTVLKEKYNEIIEKLRQYPPTSVLIPPGAVPLKPISMNLFINITNALLSELCGPSNAVNAKNYSEKVEKTHFYRFAITISAVRNVK